MQLCQNWVTVNNSLSAPKFRNSGTTITGQIVFGSILLNQSKHIQNRVSIHYFNISQVVRLLI